MKLDTMRDLYIQELRVLYNAETQLVKFLPKIANLAGMNMLKDAFLLQLAETQVHVARLDAVLVELNVNPKGRRSKGMTELITVTEELFEKVTGAAVLDAALIAAAQRIGHYEIAAYCCVRTFAEQLGEEVAAALWLQTLQEKTDTDESLTELATSTANIDAACGREELIRM